MSSGAFKVQATSILTFMGGRIGYTSTNTSPVFDLASTSASIRIISHPDLSGVNLTDPNYFVNSSSNPNWFSYCQYINTNNEYVYTHRSFAITGQGDRHIRFNINSSAASTYKQGLRFTELDVPKMYLEYDGANIGNDKKIVFYGNKDDAGDMIPIMEVN